MVLARSITEPRGYFSQSVLKTRIPRMSTSGLRKEVIPDKTEDPFENDSGDIGVKLPEEDDYNFTEEMKKESYTQKGGRRRKSRKFKRRKSTRRKSKKRRRMFRK